jgi:hypothetical protein
LLQRGVNIKAPRFDLHRYRLPHISGAHQADILDLHFSSRLARGACCGPQITQGESCCGNPSHLEKSAAVLLHGDEFLNPAVIQLGMLL